MMMRLEQSIALSVALHLGIALISRSPMEAALLAYGGQPAPPAISVFLKPPVSSKSLIAAPESVVQPEVQRPAPQQPAPAVNVSQINENGLVAQKARFLVDPDLSALETMPVSVAGRVVLSLAVSHLGTVSSVNLASGDPMPSELLTAISAVFARAQLHPALDGEGKPLNSELKIVVRFEPNQVQE